MKALAIALRSQALLWQQWPKIGGHLVVGLTLALVTLPQAVAFSVTLAGVPPHFGIYAAIWGVLFCALLNPSPVFHGGPNTPAGFPRAPNPPHGGGVGIAPPADRAAVRRRIHGLRADAGADVRRDPA